MSAPSNEQMINDARRHLAGKYEIGFSDATVHRPRIWPEGRHRLHVAFKADDGWHTPVTTTLHYGPDEGATDVLRIEDDYWTKTLSRVFEARWRDLVEAVGPNHLALRVSEFAGYTSVPEQAYSARAWAALDPDAVLAAHGPSMGFALEIHAFPDAHGSLPSDAQEVLCRIGNWAALRELEGVDITWFVYRNPLADGRSPRTYMDEAEWSAPGPAAAVEKWLLQLSPEEAGSGCEATRALWRRAQRLQL